MEVKKNNKKGVKGWLYEKNLTMVIIDIIFIKLFSPSSIPIQYYSLNASYIANKRFCHFWICS
jgi:hypothetical protein